MSAKLEIEIGAVTDDLKKGLSEAEKSLQDFGKQATAIGKTLSLAVTAPLTGLAALSVANFNKQAQAIGQIETALISTGGAAGKTSQELQNLASGLQEITTFGDEEILQKVTAQLLTFTNIANTQFDRTQKAALDLATRLGGDLQGATIQLGKALNDPIANLSALSRSGIQFSEDQKALIASLVETNQLAEAQTVILDELEKQYGGSAEAAAKLGTGPLKQLSNQFGDLLEDFGALILKAINPLIERLKQVTSFFQGLSDTTKTVILVVAGVAASIGPLLLAVGSVISILPTLTAAITAVKVAFLALSGPIGLAVAAIVGAAVLIITNWDSVKSFFKNLGIGETLKQLKTEFLGLLQAVKPIALNLIQIVKSIGESIFNFFKPALSFLVGEFVRGFKFAFDQIVQGLGFVKNISEGDFSTAFERLKVIFLNLGKFLIESLQPVLSLIPGVGGLIEKTITGIENKITASKAIIEGREAFKNLADNAKEGFGVVAQEAENSNQSIIDLNKTTKLTFDKFSRLTDLANEKIFAQWAEEAKVFNQELEESISLAKRLNQAISQIDVAMSLGLVEIQDVKVDIGSVAPVQESAQVDTSRESAFLVGLKKIREEFEFFANDFENRVIDFVVTINNSIERGLANAFVGVGDALGEALVTGQNVISALGKSLLNSLSAFLGDLGQQLIAFGVAGIAFASLIEAIKKGGPLAIPAGIAAIAAGTALVAISSAIKSSVGRGLGGGGGISAGSGVGATVTGTNGLSAIDFERSFKFEPLTLEGDKIRYIVTESNKYSN